MREEKISYDDLDSGIAVKGMKSEIVRFIENLLLVKSLFGGFSTKK